MMTNLADILAAIPSLSSSDKVAIASAIKADGQFATPESNGQIKVRPSDTDAEIFADVLCEFLKARGIEHSNATQIKRTDAFKHFKARSTFIGTWLEKSGMTRNEKRLLLGCTMPLLHKYLAQGENAVGANQMLLNAYKLPAIVDAQLPGYAHAGLLRLVIKRGGK